MITKGPPPGLADAWLEGEREGGSVWREDALSGQTRRQYRDIRVKAELLVEE